MQSNNEEETLLTPDRRKEMLSRLNSQIYWVGKFIPKEWEIEGERVELRDLVFEYISKSEPSEQEVKAAFIFAKKLAQDVKEMERRLREDDMTVGEAEELLDSILGVQRAIDELRQRAGSASDVKLKALLSDVADERRWRNFVRDLTG